MTEAFLFPLEEYLRRLGWMGSREPSADLLRGLHRAQVRAISFENLSPLLGEEVDLKVESLCAKMLSQGRGGYCFELNGIFLAALQHLGFRTTSLLARVSLAEGVYGKRSHQVTQVEIDGKFWLADVGFGGNGLIEPILLEEGAESDQRLDRFRLMRDETYGYRLEHWLKGQWRTLYAFSREPYQWADYRMLNYFVSKSPDSIFTRIPLCVRTMEDRRLILFGDELKIRTPDGKQVTKPVQTPEAFREVLRECFGINWPVERELPAPRSVPAGAREV